MNSLIIEPGTPADLDALSALHYRGGPPATIDLILRGVASDDDTPSLAGVLVVSRPVLNAPWRVAAWGDAFAQRDKRTLAALVNREVRTISRVIVAPTWRGLGIAQRLTRAYLARPLTPRTEAIAAMGRWCPFFVGAGMRAISPRPARRDVAFRAALARRGLAPWRLLEPSAARSAARVASLRMAARAWARASRATRRLAAGPAERLALAAAHVLASPLVFVSP